MIEAQISRENWTNLQNWARNQIHFWGTGVVWHSVEDRTKHGQSRSAVQLYLAESTDKSDTDS